MPSRCLAVLCARACARSLSIYYSLSLSLALSLLFDRSPTTMLPVGFRLRAAVMLTVALLLCHLTTKVTTGVLGSFNTDTAREGTKGLLDEGLIVWHPPVVAAEGLLTAGARRWRQVFVPWEQTRIATLLHPLMPETMDWVIRYVTLSGEGNAS